MIVREPLPEWPLFGMTDDVRPALRRARDAANPCVLATLTAVEGGGPRPPGTQMVFAPGVVAGYFSGGCVESDVADHAFACLADGEPRRLVYGQGSPWPDIRLLCGARIEIFLERVAPDDPALSELLDAQRARRPVVWVSDGVARRCAEAVEPWPEAVVLRHYLPVPRLIVVGGDPTALAIAQLGALAEFETTLVRSKGPQTPPPIPGLAYRRDEPKAAFAAIGVDEWTAIAIATHDLETDRAALHAALPSGASYVGLLGARRRIADRLAPLRADGASEEMFDKLRAPIGLDIGGKAPWEVAVSVIGEIMALRYARDSGSTATTLPAAAASAPAGRRNRASEAANTLTSEESWSGKGVTSTRPSASIARAARIQCSRGPLPGSGAERRATPNGRAGSAPDRAASSGRRNSSAQTRAEAGLPGRPSTRRPSASKPNQVGLPGRTAMVWTRRARSSRDMAGLTRS